MTTPHRFRALGLAVALAAGLGAGEVPLPPRPPDAPGGSALATRIGPLDPAAREAFLLAEIRRGNVPDFWRRFVPVPVTGGTIEVAPDYLAVGHEDDYLLVPLTPDTAQQIADELDCVLPTRRMADLIHRAATVKLEPAPIPPSAAMTTAPVFAAHSATVAAQLRALPGAPPGALVAGHKKDVVISPQQAGRPGRVAIYGWHRPDGTPIQPLFTGHDAAWVDYSHGIRLVRRQMTLGGASTTVDAVLADDARWVVLSDEGPMSPPRQGKVQPVLPAAADETWEALFFEPGIRVLISRPAHLDASKPVRLVLYALPAGNTIEQTVGRTLRPGDDWHFDIQHIGAQTRWLRTRGGEANLVVAYLECAEKSWVVWRRAQPEAGRRIVALVDGIAARFTAPRVVLASHSAGGSLVFGYLDGVERIPPAIERIAFLDSNYAYDAKAGHAAKLADWLAASPDHRLGVIAYEDHRARLEGKPFVSEQGGTWGRSQAMLADLAGRFGFVRHDDGDGLQRHTALDGRVEFILKPNPEQKVWHTRLVELNGFIEALLGGTAAAGRGYVFLGERAYGGFILPPPK